MQIKKIIVAVFAFFMMMPLFSKAQDASVGIYSPYTLYGVGNINSTAPVFLRAMGGAGVAYTSPIKINTLNPASNSYAIPHTFLLSIGGEGGGYYLKSNSSSTSENFYNFSDIAVRFPIAKGWGAGVSVTPYSSVGYSIGEMDELSYTEAVEYNAILNTFTGSGGVSQIKAGVGGRVFKNFSVGADVIFYFGKITRGFTTSILTNNSGYKDFGTVTASTTERFSSVKADFGLQYDWNLSKDNIITFGATYVLGGKLGSDITRQVATGNDYGDFNEDIEYSSDTVLPNTASVGVAFRSRKSVLLLDYSFAAWKGTNNAYEATYPQVKFVDTHSFKLGFEHTPDRYNIRSFAKRINYRAGLSYGNSYMQFYGDKMTDKSITLGVGLPFKQAGISSANISVELGEMGTIAEQTFRQRYFKVSVGISLFGDDQWFVKHKYN